VVEHHPHVHVAVDVEWVSAIAMPMSLSSPNTASTASTASSALSAVRVPHQRVGDPDVARHQLPGCPPRWQDFGVVLHREQHAVIVGAWRA
jgi:hypothetical protein